MIHPAQRTTPRPRASLFASLALTAALAGCAAGPVNSSLNSVHQPVVERSVHAINLATPTGALGPSEQQRLAAWFAALPLSYGDKLVIEGGTAPAQADIAALAARSGVLPGDTSVNPAADVAPGNVRVSVLRSRAFVPGCPDWSANSTTRGDNATSPNFGCAVNSNLAAMLADPEHLLKGAQGTGETVVTSAAKAIATYRETPPTGAGGLRDASTTGGDE